MRWHKTPVVVKSDGGECVQGWGLNAPALRLVRCSMRSAAAEFEAAMEAAGLKVPPDGRESGRQVPSLRHGRC